MYHMVRALGQRFDVDLVGPAAEGHEQAMELLRPYCRDIEFVPPRCMPVRRPIRFGPYECDPAVAQVVDRRLSTGRYGAVQIEKPAMLVYLRRVIAVPAVLDVWAYGLSGAFRALRHEPGLGRRLRNLIRLIRFGLFDRFCWPRLQTILVVSEHDRARCARGRPGSHVLVVPNGVDSAMVRPGENARQSEPHTPLVLFTGDMSFAPNIDAARLLVRSILPAIRAEVPTAQLHLVGRNPEATVQSLAGPAVKVIGEVRDMLPYLREATVFVAPLFTGAGTRTKLLEAMAAGLPIVTTTIGIEGIEARHEREVLIADDPQALAAETVRLLRHPEDRQRLGSAARRLAEERYDWSRCLKPLIELYASFEGRRTPT